MINACGGAEKASTDRKRSLPPFAFRGSELFTYLWSPLADSSLEDKNLTIDTPGPRDSALEAESLGKPTECGILTRNRQV